MESKSDSPPKAESPPKADLPDELAISLQPSTPPPIPKVLEHSLATPAATAVPTQDATPAAKPPSEVILQLMTLVDSPRYFRP